MNRYEFNNPADFYRPDPVPQESIAQLRTRLSSRAYIGQYQQTPVWRDKLVNDSESRIIKPSDSNVWMIRPTELEPDVVRALARAMVGQWGLTTRARLRGYIQFRSRREHQRDLMEHALYTVPR